MRPREMAKEIYCVGALDWDRRLFDSLIPLPDGTSYNSYLIRGKEKTALVDTVDPTRVNVLLNHLNEIEVDKIDYIVTHHAEQDHSGSLGCMLDKFPKAQVICTPRCKGMLVDLLMIAEERITTVEDGQTISLGERTLEFLYTPWVHWPETMVTYLREDRILFSCDFFGSHLATTDMYVTDECTVFESAKRYYAEIMMPFRTNIQKNLQKLEKYDIGIIAPSHGPMYDEPKFILNAYRSWAFDEPRNIVILPYISMHDSTRAMVEYFTDALAEKGVTVKRFDLTVTDIGKLAMSLVDAATIVIGTPTVLAGPHPKAVYAAVLANALRPNLKFASIIGSYGWGGKTVEVLTGNLPNLKVEVLEPVLCQGYPRDKDYEALDKLASAIADKHREHGYS